MSPASACGTRSPRSTRTALAKPDKAQKAFEKTLSLDSGNLIAAEALIPIYEKAKDARRLAGVLQVQLLHTTEAALRQERMLRIAQILDSDAGEKSSALAVALQATTENPVESWALDAGQRLAAETGEWASLVQVYEAALPALQGRREPAASRHLGARLRKRAGQLSAGH
jgi:hypothetical protein